MHKREYQVKKHKINRIRSLIKMFVTVIAVVVIFFLLFTVRKIEVAGNDYTNQKTIAGWYAGDRLSCNSAAFLIKYKMGKVDTPPYLDSARIGMKNPWTLKVTVKEKKIVAYAAVGTENVYFDKDGLVVLKKNDIIEKVPCIEGLDIKKAELYSKLDAGDKDIFRDIQAVAESLSDNELVPDRVVYSGSGIVLYFGNISVQLGSNNFSDKIGQISPILERLNGQEGILHMEHFGQGTSVISFEKPGETVPVQEGDAEDQSLNADDMQDGETDNTDSEDQYNSEDEDQNQDESNESEEDETGYDEE